MPRGLHPIFTIAFLLTALLPTSADAEMESALQHFLDSADLRGTKVSICVMDVGERLLLAEIDDHRQHCDQEDRARQQAPDEHRHPATKGAKGAM